MDHRTDGTAPGGSWQTAHSGGDTAGARGTRTITDPRDRRGERADEVVDFPTSNRPIPPWRQPFESPYPDQPPARVARRREAPHVDPTGSETWTPRREPCPRRGRTGRPTGGAVSRGPAARSRHRRGGAPWRVPRYRPSTPPTRHHVAAAARRQASFVLSPSGAACRQSALPPFLREKEGPRLITTPAPQIATVVAPLPASPPRRCRISPISAARTTTVTYGGPCARCGVDHVIASTPAAVAALEEEVVGLMAPPYGLLSRGPPLVARPGRAIGVLVGAEAGTGRPVRLRAFSGQCDGRWRVDGWAGPVAGLTHEDAEYGEARAAIEALSRRHAAAAEANDAAAAARLGAQRKAASHALQVRLQDSYRTKSRGGRDVDLRAVWLETLERDGVAVPPLLRPRGPGGPAVPSFPHGVGDCAEPKLLHAAHTLALAPLVDVGMAVCWVGARPRAGTAGGPALDGSLCDRDGALLGPCNKCRSILGALLCPAAA